MVKSKDNYMADRISVIIPAYNAEASIERTIMSALTQSYKNIQVVVVNDGSSDSTKQIVDSLCSRYNNILFVNTKNQGVSCARNVGMDNADGEYLVFLDADDILAENALENMYHCIKENELDIVAAKHTTIDFAKVGTVNFHDTGTLCIYRGKDALLRSIEDKPDTYSVWAKMYRRGVLENVRFPEGKRIHEDSFFIFSCLTRDVIFGVYDKTVYIVVDTPDSASRGEFSEKYFDILELAERKRQIVLQDFPEFTEQSKLMLLKADMAMLSCLCKSTDKKYRMYEKQCIERVRKNRKYFSAAIRNDYVMFWSVRLHIFWLYKWLYRIKNGH